MILNRLNELYRTAIHSSACHSCATKRNSHSSSSIEQSSMSEPGPHSQSPAPGPQAPFDIAVATAAHMAYIRPATPVPSTSSGASSSIGRGSGALKRSHLTAGDKLALVTLCVEHQALNVYETKGVFWATVTRLLLDQNGVVLKDPQQTMMDYTTARRHKVNVQVKQSGTVEEETEYTQVLDKWIECLDGIAYQENQIKYDNSAAGWEAQKASVVRANLTARRGRKRQPGSLGGGSEQDASGEGDVAEVSGERKKRKVKEEDRLGERTNMLINAAGGPGDSTVKAARISTAA